MVARASDCICALPCRPHDERRRSASTPNFRGIASRSVSAAVSRAWRAAFTTIGSTDPTAARVTRHVPVVVFGSTAIYWGTVASARHRARPVHLRIFPRRHDGKVAILLTIVIVPMIRPKGLFLSKVRGA